MDGDHFRKERVLEALGGVQAAAEFFDCERQAIYQWPDGDLIPKARRYELMARRPDLFPPNSARPRKRKAA